MRASGQRDAGRLRPFDCDASGAAPFGTTCQLLPLGQSTRASYSDGNGYRVLHVATRKGSHEDVWAVVFDPRVQSVAAYLAGVYSSEIKVGINRGARFLWDSIRSALRTGPAHLPAFERVEPVLTGLSGNHEPIVDLSAEHDIERGRLREATVRILCDGGRPVGRSADWLEIGIDGETVATIDVETLRTLLNERQQYIDRQQALEREITLALTPMRAPPPKGLS